MGFGLSVSRFDGSVVSVMEIPVRNLSGFVSPLPGVFPPGLLWEVAAPCFGVVTVVRGLLAVLVRLSVPWRLVLGRSSFVWILALRIGADSECAWWFSVWLDSVSECVPLGVGVAGPWCYTPLPPRQV